MSTLHLTVTSSRYCMGMVDLDAAYNEATLRPGAANPAGPRLHASAARAKGGPETHT